MKIIVEPANLWEDFKHAWIEGMAHTHWFKQPKIFDYNLEEELKDLKDDFKESNNLFLVAKVDKDDKLLGALCIKIMNNIALIRGWQPTVPPEKKEIGVAESLINYGLKSLKSRGVLKVNFRMKFPYNQPKTQIWPLELYRKFGFKQEIPIAIQLLADLRREKIYTNNYGDAVLETCDGYNLEEFVEFTLRAYASTQEDKAIHGWDSLVSNPEEILKCHQAIRNNKLGEFYGDCCKLFLVDSKVAGYILSVIRKSKYVPPFGLIANLGVFPEYRRGGIGYILLIKTHETFRNYGCLYAYVGTPETNGGAIKLYTKAGYKPVFKLITLFKKL
ncbi:MAG: GNAT family N-acetyltransferase [Candidatus Hodarchaeota archaeon]